MNIDKVDIGIGASMYGRMQDMTNTPAHVLAEFIDNALQSFIDNRENLSKADGTERLTVTIDMEWDDEADRYSKITITDNAGGIGENSFAEAFKTARTPDNNQGLNEFGMGMKTATLWLGETWILKTTALGEDTCRKVKFDVNEVTRCELKQLEVETTLTDRNSHWTSIEITSPTQNAFSKRTADKVANELSGIYRKYLRSGELNIVFCGRELAFKELEILQAPFYKDPDGESILWRKEIDVNILGAYRAKGFIALLRTMSDSQSGLVLLRRGRVIVGDGDNHRYKPKELCGQLSSPRSKRLFGELELEGFNVSFNKNGIQDEENLTALMEVVRDEIHKENFDLYTQGEKFRPDEKRKAINKLVRRHETSRERGKIITAQPKTEQPTRLANPTPAATKKEEIIDSYKEQYKIGEKTYTLEVQFVNSSKDLLWLDTTKKEEGILCCKINTSHVFFDSFGKPTDAVIALMKAIVIGKFCAREEGEDSASEMMDAINRYINEIKI